MAYATYLPETEINSFCQTFLENENIYITFAERTFLEHTAKITKTVIDIFSILYSVF
jgi:hypothetical protein